MVSCLEIGYLNQAIVFRFSELFLYEFYVEIISNTGWEWDLENVICRKVLGFQKR